MLCEVLSTVGVPSLAAPAPSLMVLTAPSASLTVVIEPSATATLVTHQRLNCGVYTRVASALAGTATAFAILPPVTNENPSRAIRKIGPLKFGGGVMV